MMRFRNKDISGKRQYLLELAGNKCLKCGSAERLEFDHIDPATKKFMLTGSDLTRSMTAIMAEFEKCQLLCADCHRRKTAVDRGFASVPDHGTLSTYMNRGCRCDECKAALREYTRDYRARCSVKRLTMAQLT